LRHSPFDNLMSDPIRVQRNTSSEDRRRRPRIGAARRMPVIRHNVGAEISPVWEVVAGVDGAPEAAAYRTMLKRDARFRRGMALGDVLAAYLSLLVATFIVHAGDVSLRWWIVCLAPFVIFSAKTIGLYERDQYTLRKTTLEEAPTMVHMAVFYALVVWLAQGALFHGQLARAQVFALAVSEFLVMFVARSLIRAVVLAVSPAERCVVLGSAGDAERTAAKLSQSSGVKAEVIGRVALRPEDLRRESPTTRPLGDMGKLARIIADHNVERVVIAPDGHDQEEILQAIRLVKAIGVKVSVLPRLLEVVGSSSTFDEVGGMTLLGVRQYGLSKSSEFLKRTVDLGVATAGLVVLAPLLALLAITVKLDSRGPVFFRQPRIGRRGESFNMLKFRSMVPNAEQIKNELRGFNEAGDGLFKITDDPRITRVGGFLRRTSLDELPQLFNVLSGDMSLVGPRPLVPDEDALIEGWKRRRLAVKPGMTGLWQVFGSSRIPMSEMVKIDYIYGANWSIWLDLKILLRTVPYVLRRRGL
jgi:exopolysaccharide biosynthesis polyprenyl glycosylphosphotransferase